jgi:chromate reductase, NAD(P)H dehydrogenase (quinone)
MITLISGTNRPGSNTLKVTNAYSAILRELGADHHLLSLEQLPRDFAFSYLDGPQSPDFQSLVDAQIRAVEKLIVVIPE